MTTSPFLIKRNFFIKSLILFDKDQKQKDFFDSYTGQNFDIEEWLQLQMQREFIDLAFFIAKIRKQYIYLYSYLNYVGDGALLNAGTWKIVFTLS